MDTITGKVFFTKYDKDIAGSSQRDPLGLQPIWSYLGRKIIKHLTTISDQIHGFREILLCLSICNDFIDIEKNNNILIFEQLAIYSIIQHMLNDNKDISGILGADNGLKKFRQNNGNPLISADRDKTILANEISLGFYGRYKSPLMSMNIININGNINHTTISKETLEELYNTKMYSKIKSEYLRFIKNSDKHYKNFKASEELFQAVMGSFRPKEYDFWKKKLLSYNQTTNSLMSTIYDYIEIEDEENNIALDSYNIFRRLYNEKKSQEALDIINLESFLLCLEQVFFKAATCDDTKSIILDNLEEHKNCYQKMLEIFNNEDFNKDGIISLRMNAIKACNPNEKDYVKKILDYHKEVCKQKKSAVWIEENNGTINRYINISEQTIRLDRWNRTYYLSSLKEIKKGLEKLQ